MMRASMSERSGAGSSGTACGERTTNTSGRSWRDSVRGVPASRWASTLALSAAVGIAGPVMGCSSVGTETDNPGSPGGLEFRRSSLPYQSEVTVPAADRDALRDGNQVFACSLYREIVDTTAASENVFVSPSSISTVMAMTYAGARGDTASEMADALQFTLPNAALHPAMNALTQALRDATVGTDVSFQTLNSLWLARGFATEPDYLDVLSQHYDTGVYMADFAGDTEGVRESVNDWAREQTSGLVPELFGAGAIREETELVLTNAAYLSAPWLDRFDPESTEPAPFRLPDGTEVDVPMMRRLWDYPFVFDVDYRAVELPFRDANMGMVFVLPNEGEFRVFEESLDATRLRRIATALEAARSPDEEGPFLYLRLPRFDFGASVDLRPPLEALGMSLAFDQFAADFSGIDPEGLPFIDSIIHRTTIEVDEYGTTAAAASGEVMEPEPITPRLTFDRPFVFFIYDHETQSVLFMGRLVRPSGDAREPASPPETRTDIAIICEVLADCAGRTTTESECAAALEGDEPAVVEQCADCYLAKDDLCSGSPGCSWGPDVCAPDACAEYCPAQSF